MARRIVPGVPDETRAEIARRRLAELATAFDATWQPAPDDEPADPEEPLDDDTEPRHARTMQRRWGDRQLAVVAVLGLAAAVLVAWWVIAGRPTESDDSAPLASISASTPPSAPADEAESPEELVIHVTGEVQTPGIVIVAPGSRVHEAIEAAGGVAGAPDLSTLNLAREIQDGEQIVVGGPPAESSNGDAGGGAAPGGRININTADSSTLEELPGVGPVTAQAIIDRRTDHGPFRAVEDLLDVKGIGEATLAELRDRVVV
ncbi:ComEA family DNA-binding protein [Aeromicrobium sp. YIM 150415]|uniref:ComEA family DNA-binding protein n=1 Tax=Aeromicrobium sp. YIM 150415 TaxID=2803912 RepID=UPI001963F53F|nr:ComEA family DNA-binding protein [Aeromicrobium sp. YIM 150415]MBM9461919.1 ComEA family DNA-binding protein [Aeromicrobium sp. YIM 150415]